MSDEQIKGPLDLVGEILQFETEGLPEDEVPHFYARLYNHGALWGLQGSYQRGFADLQRAGVIVINSDNKAVVVEED